MSREDLEATLARLRDEHYEITSPETPRYNCFAWAADDDQHWWEPPNPLYDLLDPVPTRFWPDGALAELTVDGVISAFATRRYSECDTGELEPGFEKVAIYVNPATGLPAHAARQLETGAWTSKIGPGRILRTARCRESNAPTTDVLCDSSGVPVRDPSE